MQYEVLNYDKSVRKVHQALISCNVTSKHATTSQPVASESIDFSHSVEPSTMKEMVFDDNAKAAIRQILAMQEFADAIAKNWGNAIVERSQEFEELVRFYLICFLFVSAVSKSHFNLHLFLVHYVIPSSCSDIVQQL